MTKAPQAKPFLGMPSPAAQKLELLRELFPAAVQTDEHGHITVSAAAIQQALDPANPAGVRVEEDGYELRWAGKREAYHSAFVPPERILQPLPADSKDWDTTGNVLLKGDNLDALRLLRQSYFGQVKLIYIDPPYNTQSDAFIYRDDFSARQTDILKALGYSADALEYVQNIYGARTHSGWLSFMYPRLLLAKDLLTDDGVIFISIDDNEQAQLKLLCDEVFQPENFLSNLIWEKGRKNDAKFFSNGHEYMLVYAKSQAHLRAEKTVWREEKPGAREIWDRYLELRAKHGEDDAAIEQAIQAWYSALPKGHPSKKWSRYKRIDKHGPWRDRDISWPGGGGPRYDVLHPVTGLPCKVPERGWIYSDSDEMQRQIKLGLVAFREDHSEPPFRKAHIRPILEELEPDSDEDEQEQEQDELATQVRGSYFYKQSQVAVRALRDLMGSSKIFNNPKDTDEIARLIRYATPQDKSALILDFFAGSGTTAEAVMRLNAEDGGTRTFILVQLPEPIDPRKQKDAHAFVTETLDKPDATIFEITAERIRRAGAALAAEHPQLDTGFRVYELVEDPDALVLSRTLAEATQDDLAELQLRIATPQPQLIPRVLANLLLAEGLPLSAQLETLEDGALYRADDVLFWLQPQPVERLRDVLREARAAGRPIHAISAYAPWLADDNLLLGLKTVLETLDMSEDKLRLRG
ncbi:site-specific DNA-methyltransferase [Denitratimonas sp. CY0512]|uniref:site-specific DNA-methyltransferase n=1 Tax=Denitratimonas sp. CY0512 TaxID=3131940 RepID=UPI0030B369F5